MQSEASRIRLLARERTDEEAYWHLALDGTERVCTWGWLDARSTQLAAALSARGLGYADRLGIGLRNSPELVVSVFAAWKLGAVPIPIRWDVPDWELERLLEVIEPRVHLRGEDLEWIAATEETPAPAAPDAPDAPDVLSPHRHGICSSGSTGTPKVILSGHPARYEPALSTPFAALWTTVERPQRVLVLAPMYHVNAFATLANLASGDQLFVLEKFDATLAVDAIERHRITTFTATPTMLQRIADLPGIERRDLSSLAWILQGAAPMPPQLVRRWSGLIGAERIYMAYGMTEGLGITALRGDEWMAHEGSVGRGLRDTEIRILSPDGRPLPAGAVGDIYLRSGSYGGYVYLGQAPPLRSEDGFHTAGDMGYLDEDGYLYLVDRRVDLIVTGGANVFPAEVEAALIDHPGIADVVVIGLKDAEWGRRVHAVIEPVDPATPPTAEEVIGFAKARLAPYKVPKTVEIVEAIPRSEATKVNRGRLVEARGG